MRLLRTFLLVMCFAVTIWADIPPHKDFPEPQNTPFPQQPKQEEKGTCAGAIMLMVGVFLLGRWLIRRNNFNLQPQVNE
jgi:hypothetical protein